MSIFTLFNNLLEVFQKIIPQNFHFRLPRINELTHVQSNYINQFILNEKAIPNVEETKITLNCDELRAVLVAFDQLMRFNDG